MFLLVELPFLLVNFVNGEDGEFLGTLMEVVPHPAEKARMHNHLALFHEQNVILDELEPFPELRPTVYLFDQFGPFY